jgi:hypothetical protein
MDALNGKSILQSGDTVAQIDHNIVAYRGGLLLVNGRHQGMPPLPGYLASLGLRFMGQTALAARVPFAICGPLCVVAILYIANKRWDDPIKIIILGMAILGNVSFILFFRNAHYYGPAMLMTTVIALLWLYRPEDWRAQCMIGICSGLLLLSMYSWFISVSMCLAVDTLLFRRHLFRLPVHQLACGFLRLLTPPLFAGLIVLWGWNPLGTKLAGYLQANTAWQRIQLFGWTLRDLNACEFISAVIAAVAIVMAFKGSASLSRMLVGMATYIICMTLMSTQVVSVTSVADIRYMAAALPLCIAITSNVLTRLWERYGAPALLFAALACFTNVFNGGIFSTAGVHSTINEYIHELVWPPEEPYGPTADWLNRNATSGQSVWVVPDYATYPLMFHAPHLTYAWQFDPAQANDKEFRELPAIHFKGAEFPDFIVAFGPFAKQIEALLVQFAAEGHNYERVATINVFWKDLYRPELFWRTFRPIRDFDPSRDGIQVFKKAKP